MPSGRRFHWHHSFWAVITYNRDHLQYRHRCATTLQCQRLTDDESDQNRILRHVKLLASSLQFGGRAQGSISNRIRTRQAWRRMLRDLPRRPACLFKKQAWTVSTRRRDHRIAQRRWLMNRVGVAISGERLRRSGNKKALTDWPGLSCF